MASKNQTTGGEVVQYDPGAQQGRLEQGTGIGNPLIGISTFDTGVQAAPGEVGLFHVTNSPEGLVTAPPGSLALSDTGVLYIKASGSGNLGWVAVGTGGGGTPEAACYVGPDGTIGSVVFGTGFLKNCTVVRDDVGSYLITLDTPRASNASVAFAISQSSGGIIMDMIPVSDAVRQVDAYNAAGALTDVAFTFALFLI